MGDRLKVVEICKNASKELKDKAVTVAIDMDDKKETTFLQQLRVDMATRPLQSLLLMRRGSLREILPDLLKLQSLQKLLPLKAAAAVLVEAAAPAAKAAALVAKGGINMNIYSLVWQELLHRKSQLVSGLLAITLGIAVIVGIRSVAVFSEKAVAVKLDNLGANILVLPQGAGVDDYYSADIDAPTFPENYVERITASTLPGVDNLSPKLTRRVKIGDHGVVLTGILPAGEIASKPIWQTAGLVGGRRAGKLRPVKSGQSVAGVTG